MNQKPKIAAWLWSLALGATVIAVVWRVPECSVATHVKQYSNTTCVLDCFRIEGIVGSQAFGTIHPSALSSMVAGANLHPWQLQNKENSNKGATGIVLSCRFRGPLGGRLLQRRGSLILRKLSLLLGPQKVFCALANILDREPDLRFASAMVQALNVILLTAPEVTAATSLGVVPVLMMCCPSATAELFVSHVVIAQLSVPVHADLPGGLAGVLSSGHPVHFTLKPVMHPLFLLAAPSFQVWRELHCVCTVQILKFGYCS